jgi:hypothetical protein
MTPAEFWGSTVRECVAVIRGYETRQTDAMRRDLIHAWRSASYGRYSMMVSQAPSLPSLDRELKRFDRAMSGKAAVTVEITSREQLHQLLAEARDRVRAHGG